MTAPDPDLAGAGLSATGKTADQFEPGDEAPGTTYGAPGGTGAEDVETAGDAEQDGATADGDVEGG
ncbi:MAG: hypothetical protein JWN08_2419 [Frankiales bacterium]|jgi:hypothetical protein|nr:hypothetical protein [Frankiales bacterium]